MKTHKPHKPHKPYSSVPSVKSDPSDRFKFRVWDEDAHEYNSHNAVALNKSGELLAQSVIGFIHYPDAYSIEQCTGIRDKTGTLIYEGDVVTLYPIETKYHRQRVVTWLHDHWTTVRKNTTGANIYWTFGHHEIKVIGNIHTMSDKSVPSDKSVKSQEPQP